MEILGVNTTQRFGLPISQYLDQDDSNAELYGIAAVVNIAVFICITLIYFFCMSKTQAQGGKSAQKSSKSKPKVSNLICGPTNSGKTQLFYYLKTNEIRTTVSSQDVNEAKAEVKVPQATTKDKELMKLNLVDIPGHFHFKDQLNSTMEVSKSIIVMIDSKDKDKFSEAAEIIYEILNNITVLSDKVPVLIVCNKQDLQFAKKSTMLEAEIEKHIEDMKKTRRATLDENQKIGYLESNKKRFSFQDFKGQVQFANASLKAEDLREVYLFLNNYCQ